MKNTTKITLKGSAGLRLSLYTGMLESGFPDRFSTLHFYHAFPGDRLHLLNQQYEYAVAVYSLDREETFLYTYSYQKEENWSTYTGNLTPDSYSQEDFTFPSECYFRINLKRCDGAPFNEGLKVMDQIIEFLSTESQYTNKDWFREEIDKVALEVNRSMSVREPDSMSFILLTDSHYVVNGTWEDTVRNISAVTARTHPDGIIHLGDLTDGMVSREVTEDYVNQTMEDMKSLGLPLYLALGNHDSNYFYNNPDKFTEEEQYQLYLREINQEHSKLYYYKDMEKIRTRFIFLHSFDDTQMVRYGFSDEEVIWFEQVLTEVPEGFRVLIFSHVPPLPEIHFWSDQIRNGERMIELAESYARTPGRTVLGWIHGHNHADQIYRKRVFPIISRGCNKCEYFLDKKPEGAITYERRPGDVSQDLWDVLILSAHQEELHFVRFGAGGSAMN